MRRRLFEHPGIVAAHDGLDLRLEGYASLARVRTILGSPNFGYGFFAQGNSAPPGNGFSGGMARREDRHAAGERQARDVRDRAEAVAVLEEEWLAVDLDQLTAVTRCRGHPPSIASARR